MEQILAGLKLMLAGMGTVFLFLIIMIGWINLSAMICGKFNHLLPEKAAKPSARPSAVAGGGEQAGVIAAISAAVHRYRREKQGL